MARAVAGDLSHSLSDGAILDHPRHVLSFQPMLHGGPVNTGDAASLCMFGSLHKADSNTVRFKGFSHWYCWRQNFDVDSRILMSTSKFDLDAQLVETIL